MTDQPHPEAVARLSRDLVAAAETLSDDEARFLVDSYYQMFNDEPVMRDIWQATQADRALQKLDEEDVDFLAGLLADTLRRIAADAPKPALRAWARLVMTLIAAAVRHAITLPAKEARLLLATFKRMLPNDLAML